MAFHDQASVAGITESCKYNCHEQCNNPKCACDCHVKAAVLVEESNLDEQGKQEKTCPVCGIKRPSREEYCRVDGSRLTSLVCSMCGVGGELGDIYCWKCGNSLSGKPAFTGSSLQVPSLEPEAPEIDYGRQVVAALQAELSDSQLVKEEGRENENRKVVETPMGEAGSFKLVSGPSPVKVRHPASTSEPAGHPSVARAGSRSGFRLPVKPA